MQLYYTEFTKEEDSVLPGAGLTPSSIADFLQMKVNPVYIYRKIYCYVQPALSSNAADYYLQGKVKLLRNRQTRGDLPASFAQDAANALLLGAKSQASCFTGSNPATNPASRDALLVTLSAKFTVGDTNGLPDRLLLYPAYVQSDCDLITYNFEGLKVNIAAGLGFRAYLACLSSTTPF
jgi:hypothetical protein